MCSYDRHTPTTVDMEDPAHDVDGLERVVFVSAGARHSAALVSYGGRVVLRTTGSNAYGQLGHGTVTDTNTCASLAIRRVLQSDPGVGRACVA